MAGVVREQIAVNDQNIVFNLREITDENQYFQMLFLNYYHSLFYFWWWRAATKNQGSASLRNYSIALLNSNIVTYLELTSEGSAQTALT